MRVFDLLNKKVGDLARARFKRATDIQKGVIPKILEGKDTLIISGTGSGKTEACLLPVFSKLMEKEYEPIAVLYISPLKSLNRDLLDRILWWANKLDFGVTVRHGDTTKHQRKLQSEFPDKIFIITPEQINAMLSGKNLRKHLSNVKFIIVDEVHEIADSKRGVQLTLSLERLKNICGKPQMISLSATIGSPKKVAEFIGCEEIVEVKRKWKMDIKVKSPFPKREDKVLAEKIFIGDTVAARLRKIYELMKAHRSVLLFTNTREASEILSSRLRVLDKNFLHDVHHSSLSKDMRKKAEEKFKGEEIKSIICTSSLQLGLDIGSVDLVLQYMSPRTVTQFLQRVGRSGHGVGRVSKGIIIASEGDDLFESAVVARKAMAGELEEIRFHKKSLDVLSHQIIGLAGDEYKIPVDKVFKTVKGSSVYNGLTKKEFMELLKFLNKLKMIWANDISDIIGDGASPLRRGRASTEDKKKKEPSSQKLPKGKCITRGRKALKYYFENLSTIPTIKNYKIIDITANQFVGTLDECFIAEHGEGSTFIVKGRPWRILSVDSGKILVEPSGNIESSAPSWEGELMPVPFSVSEEVGELRRKIAEYIKKGKDVVKEIKREYPVDSQTAKRMVRLIEKQKNIPDSKNIVFEKYGEYLIMHACFGSLVNETLSRFLSTMIAAETGRAVVTRVDPYRIIFRNVSVEEIKKVLFEYKPSDVRPILNLSLPNTSLFKWRFIQTAKRFGVMWKEAVFDKINVDRLISVYKDSPVFMETLNELFTEKLDVDRTKEILRKIQEKKIRFRKIKKLSPLGALGLKYELHDVAKPDRPEAEILRLFKKRLLETKVRLVCLKCGEYSVSYKVKELTDEPRCPKCASRLLGCVHSYMNEAQSIVKKWLKGKTLKPEEEKKLARIKRSGDVMITSGKKGAMVLAGRGVGPQTALFILRKANLSEEELFKNVLREEKRYISNKKYWT